MEVSAKCGISVLDNAASVRVLDSDGDGDLDIAVAVWGGGPARHPQHRKNGAGTLTYVAQAIVVLMTVWSCHALFTDLDRDGDVNLYWSSGAGLSE